MEKQTKKSFFNQNKYKNVVEYRKYFLEKIVNILPYLVEFLENRSIIPNKYFKNCEVNRLNK